MAVYGVVVTAMASLTAAAGGTDSSLAVATATLATVGVLTPLQRRVRAAVDRRFNRAAVDARQSVEDLRSRLREASDLEQLTADVLHTVDAALHPVTTALRLQSSGWSAVRDRPRVP